MRRRRSGNDQPVRILIGVHASPASSRTSVQKPSRFRVSAMGLGPSTPAYRRQAVRAAGTMTATPIASLSSRSRSGRAIVGSLRAPRSRSLEALRQVHAGVEAGNLAGVAVEGQGLAAAELADAALLGLAPARVVDGRVDVRVKAVLAGRVPVPGGRRLLLDEGDLDDGFDALESVLPGHHQAHGRAVLVGQRLA